MKKVIAFVKTKLTLLAAVAVAAAVGGTMTGVVMAAIPDTDGRINACYKNSTKVLAVTDPAGNCATNETPINWDQSANGKVYSKALVASLDTSPQQLFSIPEIGTFSLSACINNPDQSHVFTLTYTNNSNHTIGFDGDASDDVGPGGSKITDLSANGGFGQPVFYTLGYLESPTSQKTVSLMLSSRLEQDTQGNVNGCALRAQAVASN